MAEKFVDRQSTYPNRYKITREDGTIEYVTLERADEPTVTGTPLNASTFNAIVDEVNDIADEMSSPIPIEKGGTNATDGATGLKNLFAAGATVLSSHQYGDTLPDPGIPGRIFFKKVSE